MDAVLQEMVDHHQIRILLAEYCNACDRCDEPRMANVYSDDSWDNHGPRSGTGAEFAKIITGDMRHLTSLSHLLGQSTIKVNGDTAGAETYFLAVIRAASPEGGEVIHQLGGRFMDRLIRAGVAWKIKNRTALRDWSISLPISNDYVGTQGLMEGGRTNDLCFDVLGTQHSGIPAFVD